MARNIAEKSLPNEQVPLQTTSSNLLLFGRWLKDLGRSECTGWRWRKNNWVSTLNLAGRIYITRAEILRFEQRATRGEFSLEHKVPRKGKEKAQ